MKNNIIKFPVKEKTMTMQQLHDIMQKLHSLNEQNRKAVENGK